MSRAGARGGARKPLPPGSEFNWQKLPGELPDNAPTPLFPSYDIPQAEKLDRRERAGVDRYLAHCDQFKNGPYYAVINAASTSAKRGTKERAQFDPFHGMPSYSARYQKRKRTVPKMSGRNYLVQFFSRELWRVVKPDYKPDRPDGQASGIRWAGMRAQFEDDDEDDIDEEDKAVKRRKAGGGEEDDQQEDERDLDDEGDKEGSEEDDELQDDDFSEDDDEMGGDYNAEQYFDAGDDEGDGDGFGDGGGGGGGGGDDDFY
ncbi:hypothetical protein UA08_07114 [Talaromyces atroroseus]|uniref:DNA-directed RNA polymerase III subunit n=1 Tax=Talaromyces atroroseus TaxID=1441469 RepID=A0A225ASZ6_TALAT|nr:hypothetical protein UA08_07114 [Talaromyces atroroseus]OKL57535.1 hypothetical protein UA08_07114 [Talaromyces atroroseus]